MNEPLRLAREAPASETLEASRSFETFYDAEGRTLFRRLWLVTGNRAEAEEIMQDAFVKVWERWDRVGTMDDPVGYLYRTAMNLFRKRYRRTALAIRRSIGLAPSQDDFADADDRETVRQVLATLPPRQRAALVLTEMLGFTAEDAGQRSAYKPRRSGRSRTRVASRSAGRWRSTMPSVAELLEREGQTVDLEPGNFERLIQRRDRKARNRRIATAMLAIVIALASFAVLMRAFRTAERPAQEPTPEPQGIFSDVGGWIAYGNRFGIWAVDPTHPADSPNSQIQLSTERGTPLAWSSDGSKLLCAPNRRQPGLFVLHADGTGDPPYPRGGQRRLVPSRWDEGRLLAPRVQAGYLDPGIYLIDADGGAPKLILAPSSRYFPEEDRSLPHQPVPPDVLPRRYADRVHRRPGRLGQQPPGDERRRDRRPRAGRKRRAPAGFRQGSCG